MPTSSDHIEPALSKKIAVLGSGKIGSTFAFQLARVGGHDVTVIARPGSARLRQLQRDGGIIDIADQRADVRVLDALDEGTAYDLLIVTLLDHQVAGILPVLERSAARTILLLFNTFHPERWQAAIGGERCAFGMAFVQANIDAEGRLAAKIGVGGQKSIVNEQRWAELFNGSGLPAVIEPDMPAWLRSHAPLCVAFESVSVAGEQRGGGASWGQAATVARGVKASFGLIKELGHPIHPASKRRIARAPTSVIASILWSLSRVRPFREVLATGEAECRALVDDMVASATPSTQARAIAAIRAMKP